MPRPNPICAEVGTFLLNCRNGESSDSMNNQFAHMQRAAMGPDGKLVGIKQPDPNREAAHGAGHRKVRDLPPTGVGKYPATVERLFGFVVFVGG